MSLVAAAAVLATATAMEGNVGLLLPAEAAAVASAEECTWADCTGFCNGSCPFRPNISFVGNENLTVYRMTPYNITDMAEHNTGDIEGDMGFLLHKYLTNSKCKAPYVTEACFLDDHTVVAQFNVEFDGAYGPYLKCNPNIIKGSRYLNMSEWVCAYGYPGKTEWETKNMANTACPAPCNQVNISVGKDPSMHRFYVPPAKMSLANYFGGYWYSTPRAGQCLDGHRPGDSSGCTWRRLGAAQYINTTCLADRLFATVELQDPACFSACNTHAYNRTNPCYEKCVNTVVLGTNTTKGISVPLMKEAWTDAFAPSTGCPKLKLPITPH